MAAEVSMFDVLLGLLKDYRVPLEKFCSPTQIATSMMVENTLNFLTIQFVDYVRDSLPKTAKSRNVRMVSANEVQNDFLALLIKYEVYCVIRLDIRLDHKNLSVQVDQANGCITISPLWWDTHPIPIDSGHPHNKSAFEQVMVKYVHDIVRNKPPRADFGAFATYYHQYTDNHSIDDFMKEHFHWLKFEGETPNPPTKIYRHDDKFIVFSIRPGPYDQPIVTCSKLPDVYKITNHIVILGEWLQRLNKSDAKHETLLEVISSYLLSGQKDEVIADFIEKTSDFGVLHTHSEVVNFATWKIINILNNNH